jgi:DNA-binding transcriptional LysR family regulator
MSDYDQLEFRHLKYIQAVAERGTMTAGSVHANTTQSNVSTQIKQLEEVFGIEFFTRDTQGVALTPYGEILLTAGRELLDLREEVVDMLKALRTGKITPLNLGFSSLVEKRTLASITDTIRSIFPHCEVISDGDDLSSLEARVESGDLDGALVTLPIEHRSDLMTCIVEREVLAVCMRSDDPLARHEAVPTHLLNGKLSLFQYPAVHPTAYKRMLELLNSVGITPKKSHPTTNREHIQWLVQEGQYYALVRPGTRLLPGLTSRPVHGTEWTIDTAVVMKPTSQHPALAMLLRELKKRAGKKGSDWAPQRVSPLQDVDARKKPHSIKRKRPENQSLFEAS